MQSLHKPKITFTERTSILITIAYLARALLAGILFYPDGCSTGSISASIVQEPILKTGRARNFDEGELHVLTRELRKS